MIRYGLRQLAAIVLIDFLCVVLALHLGSILRQTVFLGTAAPIEAFDTPRWLYLFVPILWILALQLASVYELRRNLTLTQRLTNLIFGHVGATLLFWGLLYIAFRNYSRLQSLYVIGLCFFIVVGWRILLRFFLRIANHDTSQASRILIVGTDEIASRLADAISAVQSSQLTFVGYIVPSPNDAVGSVEALSTLENLDTITREKHITDIVVSLKWFDQHSVKFLEQILAKVEAIDVDIRVAPDYSDVAYFKATSDMFAGIPLIAIREPILTPAERFIKRFIDIVVAAIALVACFPLMLFIAVVIRLDSPGPAILLQERIGYRGQPFMMIKFRSMKHVIADRQMPGSPYNVRKLKDDPRITRVGRILRRTSLDELPQFINVLKGEMSLVGPRPEVPWMVDQYEWWQRKRFEVPQGMTGWWQINGRADKPMYFHTSDDLYYIRNYSLWLDLRIIIRTFVIVLMGRGAY